MSLTSRFVVRSAIGLLTVGFLALFGIVGTTIWLGERAQYYSATSAEARDIGETAVELRDALRTAESSQRGYALTGNEIYLAPFDSANVMAMRRLAALERLLVNQQKFQVLLPRLSAVIKDKIEHMSEAVRLKSAGREGALADLINTHRGKALMDESNVFLSGIVAFADERLATGAAEQASNAFLLRWVSIVGAVVIIFVIVGVGLTFVRYAREITAARDQVRLLANDLENRVERRTADLVEARNRAEVLLDEVNHRVANSLAIVSSMVQLQTRATKDETARGALAETQARITAIALVHQRLYSSKDVRYVALNEYLASLLDQLQATIRAEGNSTTLRYDIEPIKVPTNVGINIGVVVAEWVTNAFKYAYPDKSGEVFVRLKQLQDGRLELAVEDHGTGRTDAAPKGTGVGTRIVAAMAVSLGGETDYIARNPGTTARMIFKPQLA